MTKYAHLLLGVIFLVFGSRAMGDDALAMTCRSIPEKVLPGQPCVVVAALRNAGNAAVEVDLGWDGYGAFWFELIGEDGKPLATSSTIPRQAGVANVRELQIEGRQTVERSLILNRWVSTDLKPGTYKVRLHLNAGGAALTADANLGVKDQDVRSLREVFDALAKTALNVTLPVKERIFAIEQLGTAQVPAAVQPLRDILSYPEGADIASVAVRALGQIEDPAAARALVWYVLQMKDESPKRNEAIRMVFQLEDQAGQDEEIKKICAQVTAKFARPAATMRVD